MTVHRPLSLALACAILALASLAARAAAVDWSKAELFTVTVTEYRFTPSDLKFRLGVPYRLHLQNDGKELHEFSAPDFFKAVETRNPEVLVQEGKEVVLPPHESKDVYFIAERPGRFPLACPDHDWAGMTGTITVE
ncbi:MAG: cupredoxin domain-containing protein [Alphaproteobacteria bacterium]